MREHSFSTIGTTFSIKVWDNMSESAFDELMSQLETISENFDKTYSRFISESLVVELSKKKGVFEVESDFVEMLRLYVRAYNATDGVITPTVGFALEDTGYDANYSLKEKEDIRDVPELPDAVSIVDDTHIELHVPVLLDFGALGKGYLVDMLYRHIEAVGVEHFLVNGSGDIRYSGKDGRSIRCGLEDPRDGSKAIGVLALESGALCASGSNRRVWGGRSHFLIPKTKTSPEGIFATWVVSHNAAEADLIATALFFVEPRVLQKEFNFEHLLLSENMKIKRSEGFTADLFAK